MTAAEIEAYEARRTRIARFDTLTGKDFAEGEYIADLVARAVPGATIIHGGHDARIAETVIWHTPTGGWEALIVDPHLHDLRGAEMSWVDSDWDRRMVFFFDSIAHGLLLHGPTPADLSDEIAAVTEYGGVNREQDLAAAMALLIQASPFPDNILLAATITEQHGIDLPADGLVEVFKTIAP